MTNETDYPDYANSERRSLIGKWNDKIYLRNRAELQTMLNQHTLSDALVCLHDQQMDNGLIIDDLSAVRYFQCHDPESDNFFIGQYNPKRLLRFQGIGRKVAPPGVATKAMHSPSCFICIDNVGWQSKGIQFYYLFEVNGNPYAALCNPFPFMPRHMTLASVEHRPQSWHSDTDMEHNIRRIVEDIHDISSKLPGWICFYNSVGAGASIEEHFHFQAFQVPDGHGLFPIQDAARKVEQRASEAISFLSSDEPSVLIVDSEHYALTVFRITGTRDSMIHASIGRLREWSRTVGTAASANLIAMHEHGRIVLYLVPRNYNYSRSIGLAGTVGGLEAMGEILFCTENENQAINTGIINYGYMRDILKGVNPPNVHRMTTAR